MLKGCYNCWMMVRVHLSCCSKLSFQPVMETSSRIEIDEMEMINIFYI